jgi:hypothetical protein
MAPSLRRLATALVSDRQRAPQVPVLPPSPLSPRVLATADRLLFLGRERACWDEVRKWIGRGRTWDPALLFVGAHGDTAFTASMKRHNRTAMIGSAQTYKMASRLPRATARDVVALQNSHQSARAKFRWPQFGQ